MILLFGFSAFGCHIKTDKPNFSLSLEESNDNALDLIKAKFEESSVNVINSEKLITEAFNLLETLLQNPKNDVISSDKILTLSKNINIYEKLDSRIIQYTQPSEIFGNSGKNTWQLFNYQLKHIAFTLFKNKPLNLEHFVVNKLDDRILLYTFGNNYEFNKHKVYINEYEIYNGNIKEKNNLLDSSIVNDKWGIDTENNILYSKAGYSLFVESATDDAKEVTIQGVSSDPSLDNITLKLYLSENGAYAPK